MNKDSKTKNQMEKKYSFLQDKSKSFLYEIDAESLDIQSVIEQFKLIDRVKSKEHFPSQDPAYWRVSQKLVGSTFGQKVLKNSETDDAIFFYSKHCHGCKKFGPLFEQVARMSMGSSGDEAKDELKGITFSRMNNTLNTQEGAGDFGYTPVFTFYKKGFKNQPYILRPSYMNIGILMDFLLLTQDVGIYDAALIDSTFGSRKLEERKVRPIAI